MADTLSTRSTSITPDPSRNFTDSSRPLPIIINNNNHLSPRNNNHRFLVPLAPPPLPQSLPIQPVVSPEARNLAMNRLIQSRQRNQSQPQTNSSTSNVIDLTGGSSPPLLSSSRHMSSNVNARSSRNSSNAVASGSGSRNGSRNGGTLAGPSGIRRGNSNVIVIDSDGDDDDDDDIVVVESSYVAPSRVARVTRAQPVAAPSGASNSITGRLLGRYNARQAAPVPVRNVAPPVLPARRGNANNRIIVNQAPHRGGRAPERMWLRDEEFRSFYSDFDSEDDSDDDSGDEEFLAQLEYNALYGNGGRGGMTPAQQMAEIVAAAISGDASDALRNHYYGMQEGGGGLAGLMDYQKKTPAKKYGIKLSHPKKIEEGYSRDIIPPPELADSPPPEPIKNKNSRSKKKLPPPPQTEPVCASCLERLLLAQNGERKPWALKCGHVVCGKCIGEAKMRCEEMKVEIRKNRWEMDVDNKGSNGSQLKGAKGKSTTTLVVEDDDEEDQDQVDSNFGPTRRSTTAASSSANTSTPYTRTSPKGKGKGKEKSRAGETGIEENWTCCPAVKCDGGVGADLLAPEGDFNGAFELFI